MNDKHLRAWFVAFFIAVFGAGIGVGLILDRYLGPRPARPGYAAGAGRGRGGAAPFAGVQGPGTFVSRLVTQLQLTADQQKQLDDIFSRRRGRLETIRGDVRAKFDAEQRELRDEIRKVLTPDQQKRFDEWLREEPLRGPGMGPGMRPGMGRGRGLGPGRGGMGPGQGPGARDF